MAVGSKEEAEVTTEITTIMDPGGKETTTITAALGKETTTTTAVLVVVEVPQPLSCKTL